MRGREKNARGAIFKIKKQVARGDWLPEGGIRKRVLLTLAIKITAKSEEIMKRDGATRSNYHPLNRPKVLLLLDNPARLRENFGKVTMQK